MTAWIVPVSSKYPDNLAYGVEKGYWDLTVSKEIKQGDEVYFWLTQGGSLIGAGFATSDSRPIVRADGTRLADVQPQWAGNQEYQARFDFEPYSLSPLERPTAADLLVALGFGATQTSYFHQAFPAATAEGEQYLRRCFAATEHVDVNLPQSGWSIEDAAAEQRYVLVKRIDRSGQGRLREDLIKEFSGRCVVSGCAVEAAVEAAHLVEVRDLNINDSWNGVLMRADIHRLFDAALLGIDADLRVVVDSSLEGTEYWSFRGQKLILPKGTRNKQRTSAFERRRVAKFPASPVGA
ncbi:HNH nuclease domain-containing protein OS=Tsukamurella paurometabola (strain ATCC 8368 / DSM/ CCUG 35730 / CIP 100753 / JCM 10117 / KCTC 9821 / NBRC 16120/ NCIMB 702349 / NCTC 13040) OX=521096 GN=Tpau_2553 PE=4 SV=1 [Tsukamurella paurometabola]|uniref:HNH nuclease domain-containing protein n=1 Tax=Tsukamurella paurometabola (strain ATCC 8368 / DSM 20162 / CCUG 35730 / CIP 100753 / JCM 10117 / KCTC 9821 / NBRC 16120 / NCIMB 702349 / NCTC 13040) TaxID=521096 RepID=D5URV1_TSUPD|nr:HNH endonuclease signature motif containing protein [Tsukamurella paurometabola]ADG79156.1 hypothetical protein Tpau_2553 [Tsukamurella paurometabola DSM 20162]SUP34318.1 Uncharacterised protein [Tsukamurella paurometabola]